MVIKGHTDKEDYLSSTQNPKIKQVLNLQQKSALRRKTGLFVVEGKREVQHCMDAGFAVETLFVTADNSDWDGWQGQRFRVSAEVYEKIAYRGSTEGVVAVVRR